MCFLQTLSRFAPAFMDGVLDPPRTSAAALSSYLAVILDAQRKRWAWGHLEGHLKEPFKTARPKQFTLQAYKRFVNYLPLSKFDCLRFPWVREHTCWCTGDPRLFWALSLFMTPELKAPGDLFCCGWPGLVLAPPGVMLSPGGRGNFGKDDACLKFKINVFIYQPAISCPYTY